MYRIKLMGKDLSVLNLNNSITEWSTNPIRKFAINKGGFKHQYRRDSWMQLLNVKYTSIKLKNFNITRKDGKDIVTNLNENNMINIEKVNKILLLDLPLINFDHSLVKFPMQLFNKRAPDLFRMISLKYNYYRGFLDIEYYLFNVLYDENDKQCTDAFIGIHRFAEMFVKDYLIKEHVSTSIKALFQRFIEVLEPKLMDKIHQENFYLETCVAWQLTLFTHNICDHHIINRLFDYFLCSPPFTVYLFSIVLLKKILFQKEEDNDDDNLQLISDGNLEYANIDSDQMIIETEQYLSNKKLMQKINLVLTEFFPIFPCICSSVKPKI